MRAKPRISLTAATGLFDAIKVGGGDPEEVLDRFGLSRATVSNPHGFMPAADFARLLEAAAGATGDDCFGLHFGEHYQPKNMGPLIYVVLNSPTLAAGIENAGRYLSVHNEAGRISCSIEENLVYVRFELADLAIEIPRQQSDYAMVVALSTFRLMLGSQWAPTEVQLAYPAPAHTSEHTRVFGCPVSFGCQSNAFVIERDIFARQVPAADERLYPILRRYLDRVLREMPQEDGLLASVRKVVGEAMRDGEPTLTQVARKIAMKPRTLQRRLKDHGLDFKRLVADTRRRFSQNYLRDRRHTLTEIAFLLGYSEVSAFNRAFRRWTGSTPSDYRSQATT